MASRPAKWRILAVTNGVDLPTNGEGLSPRPGPLHEFADSAGVEAEVRPTISLLGLLRQLPVSYVLQGTLILHRAARPMERLFHLLTAYFSRNLGLASARREFLMCLGHHLHRCPVSCSSSLKPS